jgi:hypothetical protein
MSRPFPLLWLAAVLILSGVSPAGAEGKKVAISQHDLELQIPEGWEEQPPPAGAVAYVRSADKTKSAVLIHGALPETLAFNAGEYAESMKKAAGAANGIVLGQGKVTVEPLTFQTLKIGRKAGGLVQSYFCTTFVNQSAFTLTLLSDNTDASTDSELVSILHSVHFLHPPQPVASATGTARASANARNFAGRHSVLMIGIAVLLAAAIAFVVVILVRRHRAQPAPPQSPTQRF